MVLSLNDLKKLGGVKMKKSVKFTAFMMALIMLFSFAGCSGNTNTNEKNSDKDNSAKTDTITVTDMKGRAVSVPKNTSENTVATTYGVVTPFFVTLNMSDRVLAATFKNKGFLRKVDEVIIKAGDIGNVSLDAESLAKFAPDVYICKNDESDKLEVAESLGIPVIMINPETPEDVMEVYELLGKLFGVEARAAEINAYIRAQLDEISALTKNIPENEKKTALVMGSELGRVAGNDMLQTIMLKLAGAKTVVDGITNNFIWVNIGTEKIFELDPEYLFITSSNVLNYKVTDITEDSAWSAMKAVKGGNVYKIPAKMDSWDMPGPGFVLAIYYMINTMYPDIYPDDKLQEKIDAYYQFMYGKTFDGETIGY